MASQISFNGIVTALPGVLSKVDASALEVPALGSAGIVAVLDMAIGGKPYSAVTTPDDWPTAQNSAQVKRLLKDGDLREMAAVMFRPTTAEPTDIPGGAQTIVLVKVNPAVQSAASYANGDGNALTLTSLDYGLFTTQIHASVAAGTDGGKLVTVDFEDTEELFDDLGETGKFTLNYTGGAGKAEAATVTTSASGVQLDFSRDDAGLDTGITQPTPGDSLEAISSSAGDTTQTITVFGLDGSNVPQKTAVLLTGTGAVAIGASAWNLVTASTLSAATAGNVTLRKVGAGATVVVFTAAQTSKGRVALAITPVDGAVKVKADGATTKKLVVRGLNSAGAEIAATATLAGTGLVTVSSLFKSLTAFELGAVEAARSITIQGAFLLANSASFPNLQKLKDKIATMADFAFVSLVGNPQDVSTTKLDFVTASTVFGVTTTFFAVLEDMIAGINAKSQLVLASRAANATGAPSNTSAPIYLAGGHEGDAGDPGTPTATTTDYQNALDKLKDTYVNTVLVGSSSAAVHAQLDDHIAFMCGEGDMERDGFVAAAANETFSALKTRARNLNTRHIRLCGQEVKMFNIDGESVWQAPKFQAAIVAAMQAGAAEIGTPMTGKYTNKVQDFRQHSSWGPTLNGNDAVQAGLLFMRRVAKRGIKVVRNVTTYLVDNNPAYVEAHQNQEANNVAFNLRARLEDAVGKKGFPGTTNAAKALIVGELDLMMRPAGGRIVFGYQAPQVTLDDDTLAVEVGCAVVPGINFVPITINLERARAAA